MSDRSQTTTFNISRIRFWPENEIMRFFTAEGSSAGGISRTHPSTGISFARSSTARLRNTAQAMPTRSHPRKRLRATSSTETTVPAKAPRVLAATFSAPTLAIEGMKASIWGSIDATRIIAAYR